ncbi:hypothetical protein M5K25_000552 [Dendrobium thyrsiflorum]|uniref:Uncharacterized protein n=1 Tax=Dendrobium thyrsiflorum TaxID=117978 RepID=A0ABD0VTX0_DENTH
MAAKKMDALEGEMEQIRVKMEEKNFGMEENYSRMERKFTTAEGMLSSMENYFENMEDMMKKLIEMQSKASSAIPRADMKGKKVQEDDDEVESVLSQGPPRGFRWGIPKKRQQEKGKSVTTRPG